MLFQDALTEGQFLGGVDAQNLVAVMGAVGADLVALADHDGGHVGQVVFALCVVALQLGQAGEQLLGVEDIDADIQLIDGFLLGSAVLVLYNTDEGAVFIPHDAAIGQLTVGDAGEGRLALLELILVLDVMGGGWGDSDDLVGIGVRLGAKLFQLEVVVIVVHLRLLSDLDCVLWFKRRGEQTSRGFISASFCFRRATISSLIRFILDQ